MLRSGNSSTVSHKRPNLWFPASTLHMSHLEVQHRHFCSSSIAYELGSGASDTHRRNLQIEAVQRLKYAAAGMNGIFNELIILDMQVISPTMILTAMICTIKIHCLQLAQPEDLARQQAAHKLNLYIIVLSHLKKTHWTVHVQHNL